MLLQLFTQPFCAPCVRARHVVDRVSQLVPGLQVEHIDVVARWELGQAAQVFSTPVIRLLDGGEPVFRAESVPTVDQLLAVLAAHTRT